MAKKDEIAAGIDDLIKTKTIEDDMSFGYNLYQAEAEFANYRNINCNINIIVEALKNKNPVVRRHAIFVAWRTFIGEDIFKALVEVAGNDSEKSLRLDAFRALRGVAENTMHEEKTLESIEYFSGQYLIDIVKKALKNPDKEIQQAVRETITYAIKHAGKNFEKTWGSDLEPLAYKCNCGNERYADGLCSKCGKPICEYCSSAPDPNQNTYGALTAGSSRAISKGVAFCKECGKAKGYK